MFHSSVEMHGEVATVSCREGVVSVVLSENTALRKIEIFKRFSPHYVTSVE